MVQHNRPVKAREAGIGTGLHADTVLVWRVHATNHDQLAVSLVPSYMCIFVRRLTPVQVQQSIAIWLRWLRLDVGFDAWRFDFVKGAIGWGAAIHTPKGF